MRVIGAGFARILLPRCSPEVAGGEPKRVGRCHNPAGAERYVQTAT